MADIAERIGIVGDGQLGRMLTEAAKPLGFEVAVLGKGETSPSSQVGAFQIQGDINDPESINRLAEWTGRSGVISIEVEHVGAVALQGLVEDGYRVEGSPYSLEKIKDKFTQKTILQAAGIPVAPFKSVESETDLMAIRHEFGDIVVKARKGGFDGRANKVVNAEDDTSWENVKAALSGSTDGGLYAEKQLPFSNELAVIVSRDLKGNRELYSALETEHKNNICHTVSTLDGHEFDPRVLEQANDLANAVADAFPSNGVMAIEMFVVDGKVLVNEIAPRVHNSGHLTIEAAESSQFLQHIRGITGLPLGGTAVRPAAMVNILGERNGETKVEGREVALSLNGVYLHLYGKSPTKIDRKMGHITALGSSAMTARVWANLARKQIAV